MEKRADERRKAYIAAINLIFIDNMSIVKDKCLDRELLRYLEKHHGVDTRTDCQSLRS